MNMKKFGIFLILISPSFFLFQIWLAYNPTWLNFFGLSHGYTWDSIYYVYLLPSWIFLAVMLSLGIRLYIIESRKMDLRIWWRSQHCYRYFKILCLWLQQSSGKTIFENVWVENLAHQLWHLFQMIFKDLLRVFWLSLSRWVQAHKGMSIDRDTSETYIWDG